MTPPGDAWPPCYSARMCLNPSTPPQGEPPRPRLGRGMPAPAQSFAGIRGPVARRAERLDHGCQRSSEQGPACRGPGGDGVAHPEEECLDSGTFWLSSREATRPREESSIGLKAKWLGESETRARHALSRRRARQASLSQRRLRPCRGRKDGERDPGALQGTRNCPHSKKRSCR